MGQRIQDFKDSFLSVSETLKGTEDEVPPWVQLRTQPNKEKLRGLWLLYKTVWRELFGTRLHMTGSQ